MPELYAPGDVEEAVVTLLNAGMMPPVSTKVPNPRSDEHVRVTSLGGTVRNFVQMDSRVLVECWSTDETDAVNLARLAWALLFAASDSYLDASVYATRIQSTGPVNFPDPDTDMPRYQFISTITTSLTEVSA